MCLPIDCADTHIDTPASTTAVRTCKPARHNIVPYRTDTLYVALPRRPSPRAGTRFAFDFVKLDGDGPEGKWMRALDLLLSSRAVTVRETIYLRHTY